MRMNDWPASPPGTWRLLPVRVQRDGARFEGQDCVAEEVPVALEFNGISHAVMMATPADLEDFVTGFALSEGIVGAPGELLDVEVAQDPRGWTVQARIPAARFATLKERRRSLAGRTGCGLCGTESLDHAVRLPAAVPPPTQRLPSAAVAAALRDMRGWQSLGAATGSTHVAMWCDLEGRPRLSREDVGRHNALDKLIGALARDRVSPRDGFVVVSSRASYEMVQKAAAWGCGLLVAVSGVTGLAADVAAQCGVTLVGFARGDNLSVYGADRHLIP